jgi:hypothetical protein
MTVFPLGMQPRFELARQPRMVTHAALRALSALEAGPPLRAAADARLQQLVRGNAQKVRDFVQIADRPLALPGEELANPNLAMSTIFSEKALRDPALLQEGGDVLGNDSGGAHRP